MISARAHHQRLSVTERQELAKNVMDLVNECKTDKTKVKEVVQMIRESPTYQGDKEHITLDVDHMDYETQKMLQDYIKYH